MNTKRRNTIKANHQISRLVTAAILTLTLPLAALAAEKVGVNLRSFTTVETHMQMDRYQNIAGGINTFKHNRDMVAIDKQTTIAMNRDTLYSFAVVNLSKPVTLTLPEHGDRFMSMQIISEGHYTPDCFYKAGEHVLTKKSVGSLYAFVAIRTFVDPNSPADLKAVHALQDQVKIEGGGDSKFVLPNYDMDTYKGLHADLQKLIRYPFGATEGGMGKKGTVNELFHAIVTAAGWGLNAPEDAGYEVVNGDFDPQKKYRIDIPADIPVKGFWSVSVYNKEGYFVKNAQDGYVVNNITGKKNADGSTIVFLGACENEDNCLPLPGKGSYYQWRFYVPDSNVRDGSWKIPKAVQVNKVK